MCAGDILSLVWSPQPVPTGTVQYVACILHVISCVQLSVEELVASKVIHLMQGLSKFLIANKLMKWHFLRSSVVHGMALSLQVSGCG